MEKKASPDGKTYPGNGEWREPRRRQDGTFVQDVLNAKMHGWWKRNKVLPVWGKLTRNWRKIYRVQRHRSHKRVILSDVSYTWDERDLGEEEADSRPIPGRKRPPEE